MEHTKDIFLEIEGNCSLMEEMLRKLRVQLSLQLSYSDPYKPHMF